MGAWGYGPFDSDSALDYLGDLAHATSREGDDGERVDVNHAAVSTRLREALTALTDPDVGVDDPNEACADAYAAAGLVAAALTVSASPNTGTRLFASLRAAGEGSSTADSELGLGSHCGYVDLLTTQGAGDLTEAAVAAVAALRKRRDWLETWVDSPAVEDLLSQLAAILGQQSSPIPA